MDAEWNVIREGGKSANILWTFDFARKIWFWQKPKKFTPDDQSTSFFDRIWFPNDESFWQVNVPSSKVRLLLMKATTFVILWFVNSDETVPSWNVLSRSYKRDLGNPFEWFIKGHHSVWAPGIWP
jgi:hypothetical protein